MEEKFVGKITHYYGNIGVGIIELEDSLKVGDMINVKGKETDFEQAVDSIEIDHKAVKSGQKGEVVGIKLKEKGKEGDSVFIK